MTPEQLLASLQEEVKGLAETVQRLSAENMVLKSQTSSETVRSVTMANEIARLNKPSVFAGTEDEFGDWDFALTCFVGTMDGTLVQELQAISSDPVMKRIPTDDAGKERARNALQYPGTVDDEGSKKDGARSTRAKRVRSVQMSCNEIREQRCARGNNALDQSHELQFRRHRSNGVEVRRVQLAGQRARRHFRY